MIQSTGFWALTPEGFELVAIKFGGFIFFPVNGS